MKNLINMNVVIIGCGLIGQKRANSLGSNSLIACCDIDKKTAEKFSKNNNVPYYLDIEELFKNEDFDIAILSSTHNSLPGLIKKCLENKKHVLVEKPAGRFSDELEGFSDLAKANKCKVHVGFNHRYHRAFRKANQIIKSEDLGEIMFIRGRYGHGGRIGYNKEWRSNPELSGGGELIDQGSHLIDLSRLYLGDFVEVNGIATNYFWKMPVDDNAFMTLKNTNGNIAFLQVSCSEWKNMFSFEIYFKNGKLDISGLGGSYGIEKITYYKMLPEMGPPETYSWEFPMKDDSWEFEFQEFLKDIIEDTNKGPDLKDAIENLKIINKIYKDSNYDYNS